MKKVYVLTVIILLFIPVSIKILQMSYLINDIPIFCSSYTQMNKILKKQIDTLNVVSKYLSEINNDIRWENNEPDIITYYNNNNKGGIDSKKEKIDNDIFVAIKRLDNTGFVCILKEKNYILFIRESSLDSSYGLIYCKEKPIVDYNGKVDIVKLSENNWYYYTRIAE